MNYKKMYEILSKPWLDVNDIKAITSLGRDKSSQIRNNIIKMVLDDGKRLPETRKKLVPTNYVVNYLGLEIDFIKKMATA